MRDMVRARATAMRVLGKARQHLQGLLLRHGRIYPGKKGWAVAYRRWLTTVRFQRHAQQIVFQDYVDAVADAEARVERLTGQIADLLPDWSLAPVVEAVQAMRGVAFIVAVTVASFTNLPFSESPHIVELATETSKPIYRSMSLSFLILEILGRASQHDPVDTQHSVQGQRHLIKSRISIHNDRDSRRASIQYLSQIVCEWSKFRSKFVPMTKGVDYADEYCRGQGQVV
jgi:hypothetical protein